MNLIVDASVAIKWFVKENLHEEAKRLLDGGDDLYAPDLLVMELANVAWKKTKRKEIEPHQARAIAVACLEGIPVLVRSTELVDRAVAISLALNHPVYDCLYIACAEAVDGVLVTADQRLCTAVKGTAFESLVQHLEKRSTKGMSLRISRQKIGELIRLTNVMRATERHVHEKIAQGSVGSIRFVNMGDMGPFFDSPSFRGIKKFILELTREERVDLLALGWLGQGYSGTDWRAIRQRADELVDGFANLQYTYLVSLTVYLKKGLAFFNKLSGAEEKD